VLWDKELSLGKDEVSSSNLLESSIEKPALRKALRVFTISMGAFKEGKMSRFCRLTLTVDLNRI
jgi:hypothetical protein